MIVKAVKERELPEADDDFAQIASEFDTIAELRDSLKERVGQQSTFTQGSAARDKLIEQLLEQVEIPVPPQLIEDEVHTHLEGEGRLEDDVHRAEVTEASEKQFRTQMLLDAIAENVNVSVSQDELTQYLVQSAAQYGMAPQDFVERPAGEQPAAVAIVGEVARNKALAVALGKVTSSTPTARRSTSPASSPIEDEAEAEDAGRRRGRGDRGCRGRGRRRDRGRRGRGEARPRRRKTTKKAADAE